MNQIKCIDDCTKDNIYIYGYQNICYDNPPLIESKTSEIFNEILNTSSNGNKETKTFNEIINTSFIVIKENETLDEILKYYQDNLLNIIKNSNVTNGEDYIQIEKNVAYIVTTTENQKNNKENNYSTIDFGECEDTLKEKYNISQNDSLILFKIDVLIDNILKVEYELYYPFTENNLTKLDLSFCKDKKIDILIPINIPFNEIDKYNISSGLYNDICYTLTTESGTDEIL